MRDRLELRARDPVARCLIRRLVVPRIYFDAEWPGLATPVDVLAIDRDGVGDAHLVQLRGSLAGALGRVPELLTAAAPFRWVAFLRSTDATAGQTFGSREVLYAHDTAGRVGVIEVVEMADGDLGANVWIAAERFPSAVYDVATEFSGSHKAHIQFGG